MVRIPQYVDSRGLDAASDTFRPWNTHEAERDMQHGLDQFAHGIDTAAKVNEARQNRDDKFLAEGAYNDFVYNAGQKLAEAQNDIEKDGAGFHDKVMADIAPQAQTLLDSMPASQRQRMAVRIQGGVYDLSNSAASIQFKQNRQFISQTTQDTVKRITDNTSTGLWDTKRANAEIDGFLSGAGLAPNQEKAFREIMEKTAETGRASYLSRTSPAEFSRQLQTYGSNAPSATATPLQQTMVEQAKAYGEDPRQMLLTAELESGNNPEAVGKGSIKGLFQMTRSNRLRLASMLGTTEENIARDPAMASAGMAILLRENRQRLEQNGLPVTAMTLWGGHLLGPGGIKAFLQADPNTDAYALYKAVAGDEVAKKAFSNNGDLLKPDMTVGQVLAAMNGRVDGAAQKVDAALQRDPSVDTNAPVKVMGEEFKHLTAADIVKPLMDAQAAVVKQNNDKLLAQSKDGLQNGSIQFSIYDSAARKAKDDADRAANTQQKILAGDQGEYASQMLFAQQHGYLSKPTMAAAMEMINSKDRAKQLLGYELAAAAERANPTHGLKLSGMGGDQDAEGLNTAAKINDYVNLTTHGGFGNTIESQKEAIRRVELRHSADFKLREKDIKATVETAVKAFSWSDIKRDQSLGGSWWPWGQNSKEPVTPDTKNRLEQMGQEYMRFHMMTGATVDIAKSNALADLRRAANFTRTGDGQPRLMPFPPEQVYGPADPASYPRRADGNPVSQNELSPAAFKRQYGYINDQALAVAKSVLKQKGVTGWEQLQAKDIRLTPDGATSADVKSKDSQPRFTVWVVKGGQNNKVATEFRADTEVARQALTAADEAAAAKPAPTQPASQPAQPSAIEPYLPHVLLQKGARRVLDAVTTDPAAAAEGREHIK